MSSKKHLVIPNQHLLNLITPLMQITLGKTDHSISFKLRKLSFTKLKSARSPNRKQSVNSRAKLTVRFLRKEITNIKWVKYKSHDNNTHKF